MTRTLSAPMPHIAADKLTQFMGEESESQDERLGELLE
jgi:hypothetical protein